MVASTVARQCSGECLDVCWLLSQVTFAYSGQVTAQEGSNASERDTDDFSSVIFVMNTASENIDVYRQCTVLPVTLVTQCDPYSVFVSLLLLANYLSSVEQTFANKNVVLICHSHQSPAWHFKA